MLSIIICSVNKESLDGLIRNIEETIGLEHEIIAFDNSRAAFGIARVYNEGAKKASYPYLCYMHEDILFETQNWGGKLIAHFSDPSTGLLGVAGGDTKGLVPSSWSSSIFESEISLIQYYRDRSKTRERILKTGYPADPANLKRVCCIDGVLMCTRKEVMDAVQFDEKTCDGFHGYDIDFSLQVGSLYQVGVVFDILIHHFSDGNFNREWLRSSIRISDKWKSELPRSVRKLSKSEFVRQHWTAMNVFIDKMMDLEYHRMFMCFQLFKYSRNRFFNLKHFLHSSRKILFKIKG